MNNLFKKEKMIKLDNNFTLSSDGYHGICLTFTEKREREKTVKIEGKTKKTGEVEEYDFEDKWYFTTISPALERYMELKQVIIPSMVEILEVQKEILEILSDFREKYKNW